MSEYPFQVAIDGPAGAGKSTVARLVAKQLSFTYVDTGAMYRAVTWTALQAGLIAEDANQIAALVQSMTMDIQPGVDGQRVFVNGVDVSGQLRLKEVHEMVSPMSQIEPVRVQLIQWQRDLSETKPVVMDGRDIGTRVLPNADVKIFLTADLAERAKRRWLEMKDKYLDITIEQLTEEIRIRDERDMSRSTSPLICADDAITIDTSGKTIEAVVSEIIMLCEAKLKERYKQ